MDGVNIVHLITVAVTLVSMGAMTIGFIWAIKANTMVLDTRFTERTAAMSASLTNVQEELKKLNALITEMAVQNQRLVAIEDRLNGLAARITTLDQRYEELRHGEGFVFPLADRLRGS